MNAAGLCLMALLLLQLSAAKNQPTYAELLLQNKRLEEKMDATVAIVDSIKAGLNARINNLNATWTGTRQTAYFVVDRTSDTYVSSSQKVIFNRIRTMVPSNLNGYDVKKGTYRCPYDGTYIFFFTLMGYLHSSSYPWYRFAITKDGTYLAFGQAYLRYSSSYANYYETISAMAVTNCKRGQSVYVREAYGYQQYVYALSHFTGCKIE